MSGFLDMGGYGAYVWPAYALAAVVLLGMAAASVAARHRRRRELEALESVRPGRRRAAAAGGEVRSGRGT